jgi:hypothetical protein
MCIGGSQFHGGFINRGKGLRCLAEVFEAYVVWDEGQRTVEEMDSVRDGWNDLLGGGREEGC